jgi:dual specificity tyrosine-phosphorylation-regulated kinase 1
VKSLTEVIGAQRNRTSSESGNTPQNYKMFVDLINRMLAYDPEERIKPEEALNHPFILYGDPPPTTG